MKKILLTSVAIAALSTSALAEMDNNFYALVEGGVSFYNNVTGRMVVNNQTMNEHTLKAKGVNGVFGAGFGGYVMDNVRGDLVYNYFLDQDFKYKDKTLGTDVINTAKAMSLLVNAYVDVVDVSMFKVFFGAGVGAASIQDVYVKTSVNNTDLNGTRTNNFAYALYAGASFGVNEGMDFVLKYSFRDNGKTKMKTFNENDPVYGPVVRKFGHYKYRTNNITLGLRFNI